MSVKFKCCFFEKKKQKTFASWRQQGQFRSVMEKSLFASFSSEKEESSFVLPAGGHP